MQKQKHVPLKENASALPNHLANWMRDITSLFGKQLILFGRCILNGCWVPGNNSGDNCRLLLISHASLWHMCILINLYCLKIHCWCHHLIFSFQTIIFFKKILYPSCHLPMPWSPVDCMQPIGCMLCRPLLRFIIIWKE